MRTDIDTRSAPPQGARVRTSCHTGSEATQTNVSLSKWVNESLPPWNDLLSAHEVARLTRRRRWLVHALTLLGRFPKQQRFHDHAVGWAKHEVLKWLAENSTASHRLRAPHRLSSGLMLKEPLPIHCRRTRRDRGPCTMRRKGGQS
jgi:predicted DNA-binding transcriptional regulator AlpA